MKRRFYLLLTFGLLVFAFIPSLAQKNDLVVNVGHHEKVTAMDISQDGRWLVTASDDHSVRIWHYPKKKLYKVLYGFTGRDINTVKITRNGEYIAAAGDDYQVRIWKRSSGELLHTMAGHRSSVDALAFSPDGKLLASGGYDTKVKLWRVTQGSELASLNDSRQRISSLEFSRDGRWLVAGGRRGKVFIWQVDQRKLIRQFNASERRAVNKLALSQDGRKIITLHNGWASDTAIDVWDFATGKSIIKVPIKKKLADVLTLNKKGNMATVCLERGSNNIIQYDLTTGKLIKTFKIRYNPTAMIYTPDETQLVMYDRWLHMRILDVQSNQQTLVLSAPRGEITQMDFANNKILINRYNSPTLFWNGQRFLALEKSNSGYLYLAADGATSRGALKERGYGVWDNATGKLIKIHAASRYRRNRYSAISPKTTYYAEQTRRKLTHIYRFGDVSKTPYREFKLNHGADHYSFSTDESKIALSKGSNTIEVWDINQGKRLYELKGHYWGCWGTAFFKKGDRLLSGGSKGNLNVWNLANGQLIRNLKGHQAGITTVNVSPQDRFLVSGSSDGELRIWDARNYKFLRKLNGHKSSINTAVFTQDNKKVVSIAQDGEIIVWDVETGLRLLHAWILNQGKDYVFYTPDGQVEASSGALSRIYRSRNDSIIPIKDSSNQLAKGLLTKILNSKTVVNNNVASGKNSGKGKFSYYDITLLNPGEPSTKIAKESSLKYQGESIIIKGRLKNIKVSQISRVKVDGRRATFNRSDMSFSSRRISFVESPAKDVLIEIFTKDGNVTTRLLRFQTTLTNIAQKPSLVVTKGHKQQIVSLDFHPKGKYLVTASMDQSIKIWDRSLKQEFRTLNGHKQAIRKVIYSPDGKFIASCDRNETFLWRHPGGQIVKRFKTYYASVFFSADSKKLYMQGVTPGSGFSGNLLAVDVNTGATIKEYEKIDLGDNASFHPDNQLLYTKGKRWDLANGQDLGHFEDGGQKMYAWHLSAVTSTHFAAYNITKQQIQIWNLTDPSNPVGRISLPLMRGPKKIQFTKDGKRLIVGTTYYELLVFAVPTGKLVQEIKVKKGTITKDEYKNRIKTKGISKELGILNDFALSPDNKMLATNAYVTSFGAQKKNVIPQSMIGVRFLALKNGNELGVFGGFDEGLGQFSVSNNEKYMISTHYGRSPGVRLWNLRKGQIDGFIPTPQGTAYSNGKQVAVFKSNEAVITVYKVPSLKPAYTIKNIPNIQGLYLSKSGKRLIYKKLVNLGNNRFDVKLSIWDVSKPKTPKLIREIEARTMDVTAPEQKQILDFKISPDDKYLITRSSERPAKGSNSFFINSIELASGKTTMKFRIGNFHDQILDFVPEKTHVLISKITETPGNFKAQLVELDYTNGKLIGQLGTDYEVIFDAHFSPDGKYLVTGSGGYWIPENIHFDVAVWDWENKNLNCVLAGHALNIRYVWFGARGKKVYSADENSIIKAWDISNCKLAASFLGLNDDDYIILNADNFYKTSKGSIDGIGFRYKGQLRSFGQFDLRFNRPDLVMKDLGASKIVQRIYYKAWKKRLRRAGLTETMVAGEMNLPDVNIANKFDLPPSTNNPNIAVKIKAFDENVALKNLQVYVNDVPLYGKEGISAKRRNEIERTVKIKLNQGRNKVAVSAINEKGLESAKESFNIEYTAPKKKPRLFLLAIGVSEYEKSDRNLKFAQKDARNLADLLTKSATYSDTVVARVFNKDATKENILKAAEMFKKTNVDDQVVIFISCHGLLDEKMDYYLATTDVDFADPATKGLPYEAIEQMLDKIPARKRLIMIDACHSGELDKTEVETVKAPEVVAKKDKKITIAFKGGKTFVKPKAGLNNSFDYMKALFNDISNNSGATVISAAAGYEFALESKEWNNGVFTYSILNGIDSGEADLNNDGRVSVSELKDYVITQVAELTDGKQVPTTRRENQSVEVVIYEK